MKRVYRSCLLAALAAALLAAQPPAPPAPPAPPVPRVAPVAPVPPAPRMEFLDDRVQEQMDRAREKMDEAQERLRDLRVEPFGGIHVEEQMEKAREKMEQVQERLRDLRIDIEPFNLHLDVAPMLLAQKMSIEPFGRGRLAGPEYSRDLYSRGMDELDRRNYERALSVFDEYYRAMNGKPDSRADGALYWKAYAQSKLGKSADATATLAQLEKNYPSSRWINDAKALQLEVAAGKGTSPEAGSDEEMKLLAINSIANNDPERVVPLLDKILSDAKSSPTLKSRALFVLARIKNPKAGEIIVRYAKGGSNPDVQLKAVEYLGVYNTKENLQVLSDIYGSSSDPAVKRAVLRGYYLGKDKDHLLAAAKRDSTVELRQEAIRDLGSLGAHAELAQIYSGESNADIKRSIIRSLGARREKDKTTTADMLTGMYSGEKDKKLKTELLRSLHAQGAAKQLIDIARKETDPSLKQEAVRELSNMHSKEATDFMMELLNK